MKRSDHLEAFNQQVDNWADYLEAVLDNPTDTEQKGLKNELMSAVGFL